MHQDAAESPGQAVPLARKAAKKPASYLGLLMPYPGRSQETVKRFAVHKVLA
jgi:hypothetical protein